MTTTNDFKWQSVAFGPHRLKQEPAGGDRGCGKLVGAEQLTTGASASSAVVKDCSGVVRGSWLVD